MPQQLSSSTSAWKPVDEGQADTGAWKPVAESQTAAPAAEADTSDSYVGGFLRRGGEAVKGMYHALVPPIIDPLTSNEEFKQTPWEENIPGVRIAKGVYAGGAKAGEQALQQAKEAYHAVGKDPVGAGLKAAQAGVTAASIFNPLATSAVTNINEKESQDRNREAVGGAAFDALMLLAGSKVGKEPTPTKQLNKLAYATDAESVRPLQHIQQDIMDTVAQNGKPQTVGQLLDTVQQTSDKLEQTFNTSLQQMGGTRIHLQDIADALKQKANSMPRAAAAEAQELRNEAKLYDGQVTTPQELNADRQYRYSNLKGYYNKGGSGQMAAMRTNAQNIADKIVYDGARNLLYDEMDKQFPGQDFTTLKQKQSSIMEMMDHFKDHVEDLEAKQAKFKGAPLGDKQSVTANVHPGGVTPRLHGLLPKAGPLTKANRAVGSAFGPTDAAVARRAAILSLPVASLVAGRAPDVPPPPKVEDVQGP